MCEGVCEGEMGGVLSTQGSQLNRSRLYDNISYQLHCSVMSPLPFTRGDLAGWTKGHNRKPVNRIRWRLFLTERLCWYCQQKY